MGSKAGTKTPLSHVLSTALFVLCFPGAQVPIVYASWDNTPAS